MNQQPIYCAFYTAGIYEQEAQRLIGSLEQFGFEYDIRSVPDRGSWRANTHQTPGFILKMLEEHADRPVVYLDADALVWRHPVLFDELAEEQMVDLALHWRRGVELLNGTIWLAPTPAAYQTIKTYKELLARNAQNNNEQQFLAEAIREINPSVFNLPAAYCWIHDIMAQDLNGAEPVIEHLQASRVATKSSLLPSREKRLAEIAGKLNS